jgi:hypothetical protein
MNETSQNSTVRSLDGVVDVWTEHSTEDTLEMGLWQRGMVVGALGVGLVTLVLAIVLQTAYHGVILLWILFGLPLLFVARAVGHLGAAGANRVRARLDARPRENGEQDVRLTFDELALIYESLEAAKTMGALPPQDELLEDTIQIVDQGLNTFAR